MKLSPSRSSLYLFLIVLAYPLLTHAGDNVSPAVAEQWLHTIDAQHYQQSWDQASTYLKTALTAPQWQQTLTAHRQPFGSPLSRILQKTEYRRDLPGVPKGQYIIFHFMTTFKDKPDAIETVVVTKETNGEWKSIGYTIK